MLLKKEILAIISAHNTFSSSITNALTVRKDALKLAWAKPTRQERTPARKTAYDAFKTAQKSAPHATCLRPARWTGPIL